MTAKQQRIALAEWAGSKELPDYLNDLNAVHELEKKLTAEQESIYWQHLLMAHECLPPLAGCATSVQRCEAILRTLNLWKP